MIASKFLHLQTSTSGNEYVAFESTPASQLHVANGTGTTLSFKHAYNEDGDDFELPDGLAWTFRGITNADQLLVKRADDSTTQVTLKSVEVEL
ncbi:MAG: hypothetical protein IPK32_13995 [Verrucomicrobiaceae bacterium]|nr:hypothetical protein [Verrucomicrobiaceae bacterium]